MNEEERSGIPDEIPDGMDETPLYPQTVEGKIMEMRDIGSGLLTSTDELLESVKEGFAVKTHLCDETMVEEDPKEHVLEFVIEHLLKITTLQQLQTDTITQLYGELRGPGF